MPRALITGVTGQDGKYLAELLHSMDYQVFGMVRGQSVLKGEQLAIELPFVRQVPGDLADLSSLIAAVETSEPDEIYNLAAMSFVALSFTQPELTANITGTGVARMLEAIRLVGGTRANPVRFYQASSSEMFGKVRETPQSERTPFHPRSPYACAKAFGHYVTVNHRESFGLHASCGILFNHESERRGIEFVTRKITNAVARIHLGLQDDLALGNLDARRDWGHAADHVRAMWAMVQQDEPGDYVIATGRSHTVADFVRLAFGVVGIEDWERYVRQDPRFLRPAEVDLLVGDASRARARLDWAPTIDLPTLVERMVRHDLELERRRGASGRPDHADGRGVTGGLAHDGEAR